VDVHIFERLPVPVWMSKTDSWAVTNKQNGGGQIQSSSSSESESPCLLAPPPPPFAVPPLPLLLVGESVPLVTEAGFTEAGAVESGGRLFLSAYGKRTGKNERESRLQQ